MLDKVRSSRDKVRFMHRELAAGAGDCGRVQSPYGAGMYERDHSSAPRAKQSKAVTLPARLPRPIRDS